VKSIVDNAIARRRQGDFEGCRALLYPLLTGADAALAHLHIAWSFDNQGQELNAAEHYRQALTGDLSPQDRFEAQFGLASTLRCLGQYQAALPLFEALVQDFPEALEVQPFYAICLYNLGRHKEALALMLKLTVATSRHDGINAYGRAISLYAEDLDLIQRR